MGRAPHDEGRAAARRRNRIVAKERAAAEAAGLPLPSPAASRSTTEPASTANTGFRGALRGSFAAAPIRADLAFFPKIVFTRVLLVPLIVTAAAVYVAAQPGALASTWVQLAVQSLLLPPAFVLSFLGGMLTRRASWLAGGVIGIITLAGGMMVAATADLSVLDAANPIRMVLEIYAASRADAAAIASNAYGAAVMGIFAGAFAGWYGRFLRAVGPSSRSARGRRRVDAERRKGSPR